MWLCAVEEKTVDATADVAEVCFVAWFEFCDDATGVANFCEGRSHCRPVDVAVAEVDPGKSAFFAFEIFEVDLDDTPAESANPVLWIAVEQDVANVEPGLDPRALKFLDVSIHFDGAERTRRPWPSRQALRIASSRNLIAARIVSNANTTNVVN